MTRIFVYSEGLGRIGNPWLTFANASDAVMTASITLVREDGVRRDWDETIAPMSRLARPLTEYLGGNHFWLRVRIDRIGCVSLVTWNHKYEIPPYVSPVSIYDEAVAVSIVADRPQAK